VYLCHDRELDRPVAVKVLHQMVATEEARARFQREATAAARLRHPHVLRVYDQGETRAGNPFLVSEYLEGSSLDERLDDEEPVPPEQARRWLDQIAQALGAAHDAGVIHRDLKPANVMLRGGEALLCDFGLALLEERTGEFHESLTKTGRSVGTPLYMAPEVVGGEASSSASDVWALGALGYRMLYGQEWRAKELPKLILEARTLPRAPSERFGRFPGVDEALRAALHANPKDRLATTGDFLAVLRGLEPAEPAPPAPPTSSRWRLAVPGLAAIAGAAGLATALLESRPPPAAPEPLVETTPAPLLAPTEPEALRRARHNLELAGPTMKMDIRRRAITTLSLGLAKPFLEPTVPLALGRLIREAQAARDAGAPVGAAAVGLARVASRMGLVDDYHADTLVSNALEQKTLAFDREAWRGRVDELRGLAQGALKQPRRDRTPQELALGLALRALAAAPDLEAYAERVSREVRRASPEEAELLVTVTARVLRRQVGDDAVWRSQQRVIATLTEALDPVTPRRLPAEARARREVLEAVGWLLRLRRRYPPPGGRELLLEALEASWGDREVAPDDVASGYATVARWLRPRGFLESDENPYEAEMQLLEARAKAMEFELRGAPLATAPGW
jgi:hypothetical protein